MDFRDEIASEITKDFARRASARRPYEMAWRLNLNFTMGNQYCSVSKRGLEQEEKYFFWQEKQVYNHIAPIVETRLARLAKVRPRPKVRPSSSDEKDVQSAKLSDKILSSAFEKLDLNELLTAASGWSEVCGTSFFKLGWDNDGGDVTATVCPPFEIYPDSNVAQNVDDCASLIHARVFSVADVKRIWNVDVKGEDIAVFAIEDACGTGGLGYNSAVRSVTEETKPDVALVIERYTRPTTENPNGKLEIVAGGQLVYNGEMPYLLGADGERLFPFVRQQAQTQIGSFWGASVVERLIPVQRAYNAVKNRKHEFLNRLTMGVLEVEDGSVDCDNLEEEGLSPGKILVYRQGSNRPELMSCGNVPNDFNYEEDRLLDEFRVISGVSEFASTSASANVSSGTALQLLVEQDDVRMQTTIESVKASVKLMAKYVLRLYKQFADAARLGKIANDEGKVEVFYFKGSDITSDDVVFDTENELTNSVTQRRNLVLELVRSGVLSDESGNLSQSSKVKVLSMLGFGNWESGQDLAQLHLRRAKEENLDIDKAQVLSVDDHKIHIDEHTRFVVSGEAGEKRDKVLAHILSHQLLLGGANEVQNGGTT